MYFDNISLDRQLVGHAVSVSPVDACSLPLSASEAGLMSGEAYSAMGSVDDIIAAAGVSPSLSLSLSSAAAAGGVSRPTPISTTLTFNGVPLRCLALPERFLSILEGSHTAACSAPVIGSGRSDRSEDRDSAAHSSDGNISDNSTNNNNNNNNNDHNHNNNNNSSSNKHGSNSSGNEDSAAFTPRSVEEEHCVILRRAGMSTSKSSNSRYRCRYCDFEFVGGPQKIRVHLSGKKENGTRLSSCAKVPAGVRTLMESRMVQAPQRRKNAVSLCVSGAEETQIEETSPRVEENEPLVPCLQPRNVEEQHCIVLSRSLNPSSKSSNSKYKCIYCRFDFVGGPQKIRVHITGLPEGGTRVQKCTRAPRDVVLMMENRRRAAVKESVQVRKHTAVSHSVMSAPTMASHSHSHIATSGLMPANNGLAHVRAHNLQQAFQLRTALVVAANAHAQALSAVSGVQMMNHSAMLTLPQSLYLMDQAVVQQSQQQ